MPSTRRIAAAVLAALALATLIGCAEAPEPQETASPTKEAFDAVDAYLATLAEVGHDGGADPERLEAVAAGEALENALTAAASWVEPGIRVEGEQALFRVEGDVDADTAELIGCRDTSDWVFRTADGGEADGPDDGPKYLTTYTLERADDGDWRVVTESSEAGCPTYAIE